MIWILLFVCAWVASPLCAFGSDLDTDASLVGWWKLAEDCRDVSACQNDGRNHGCRFGQSTSKGGEPGAALFDGRRSFVEIEDDETLDVGTGDFSVSVYIQTTDDGNDLIGDIVSKYDPVSQKGFQLNLQCNTGVTSSQANRRHVHFGIDNGHVDTDWTDCGRPGEAVLVYSLAVFDGGLYAGTCEAKPEQSGHVYRFVGGTEWIDCGSPAPCNAVSCLAVYRGQLYAGVSKYRLGGSALTESENPHLGGKVYRYEGGQKWTDCGKLGDAEALNGMVVYRDSLYVSSMYSPGLFRYEGDARWHSCGSPNGERVEALSVFNGHIYATGYDRAGVYRYDGERWVNLGIMENCNQTYGFGVYRGELYVSSWPRSALFRYLGGTDWKSVGRLGEELESMPLIVYNGKLYSGSLPSAGVYRYDGGEEWTPLGQVDRTPAVKYRRAWSMAVYQGKLFVGTLPSGRVQSLQAGSSVTYDRALKTGWRHLTAVKKGGKLSLYVDGKCVAVSTPFDPSAYELTNDVPLTVGFGARDYFNGRLKNLRIYKRALSQTEVERLTRTDGEPTRQ